jgi:hypothetical protein
MPDSIARIRKLTEKSIHYRLLAAYMTPEALGIEIVALADELDIEVAQMKFECAGRRRCPPDHAASCLPCRRRFRFVPDSNVTSSGQALVGINV